MTDTALKRTRRSVAQLLSDYQTELEKFDEAMAKRREQLVAKIERLSARHELIAIGRAALGDKTPEEAQAELDAMLDDIRLKRRAIRKLAKSA